LLWGYHRVPPDESRSFPAYPSIASLLVRCLLPFQPPQTSTVLYYIVPLGRDVALYRISPVSKPIGGRSPTLQVYETSNDPKSRVCPSEPGSGPCRHHWLCEVKTARSPPLPFSLAKQKRTFVLRRRLHCGHNPLNQPVVLSVTTPPLQHHRCCQIHDAPHLVDWRHIHETFPAPHSR